MVDQPHVKDQAHSTFASVLFQNIMADILPSLNVVPGDAPGTTATPLLEGINAGIASGREEGGESANAAESTATAESAGASESTAASDSAAAADGTAASDSAAAAASSGADGDTGPRGTEDPPGVGEGAACDVVRANAGAVCGTWFGFLPLRGGERWCLRGVVTAFSDW